MGEEFRAAFLQACATNGLTSKHHLQASPFLTHIDELRIDAKCDRITAMEWNPVCSALGTNKSLLKVRFYCEAGSNRSGSGRNPPSIDQIGVNTRLGKALGSFLKVNGVIKTLEFERIMLSPNALKDLGKGLVLSTSLERFSLASCAIADDGFIALVEGLKGNKTIHTLVLSDCSLTDRSGARIATIIRHHTQSRETAQWQDSLRGNYQQNRTGLRELHLSANRFTDDTAISLANTLSMDRYIEVIDLSHNYIKQAGAQALLDTLKESNSFLRVLNLQHNHKGIGEVANTNKSDCCSDMSILSHINSATATNADPTALKIGEVKSTSTLKSEDFGQSSSFTSVKFNRLKKGDTEQFQFLDNSGFIRILLRLTVCEDTQSCDGRIENTMSAKSNLYSRDSYGKIINNLKNQLRITDQKHFESESKRIKLQMELNMNQIAEKKRKSPSVPSKTLGQDLKRQAVDSGSENSELLEDQQHNNNKHKSNHYNDDNNNSISNNNTSNNLSYRDDASAITDSTHSTTNRYTLFQGSSPILLEGTGPPINENQLLDILEETFRNFHKFLDLLEARNPTLQQILGANPNLAQPTTEQQSPYSSGSQWQANTQSEPLLMSPVQPIPPVQTTQGNHDPNITAALKEIFRKG